MAGRVLNSLGFRAGVSILGFGPGNLERETHCLGGVAEIRWGRGLCNEYVMVQKRSMPNHAAGSPNYPLQLYQVRHHIEGIWLSV